MQWMIASMDDNESMDDNDEDVENMNYSLKKQEYPVNPLIELR